MPNHDQPSVGTAAAIQQVSGRLYQNINNSDHARVHLGDVYAQYEDSLKHLPLASNAPFNAYHRQHDSDCLPGTREAVLKEIYEWIDGDEKSCIFWLNGWPGTGKSAIARTVARRYHAEGRLAASFFFARGGGECSHANLFVTSIARQLADNKELGIPQIIRGAFDSHIPKQTLQDQWTQLVVQPLSSYVGRGDNRTFLVVIDALDECEEEGSIGILLRLLPQVGGCGNIRVRILVTSRPETPIRHGFDQMETAAHQDFVLHRMPTEVSDRDIQVYLQHYLSKIAKERRLESWWPGGRILTTMVQYAQGLFIWAATACRFIRISKSKKVAVERLQTLLDRSVSTLSEPERYLDKLYTTVISVSIPEEYSEEEKSVAYSDLRLVLGSIVILFSTLSVEALSKLLGLPSDDILDTVAELHSILDIPEKHGHPLRLHHDSFRSFLLDENRCKERAMIVNEQQAHSQLAKGCFEVMSSVLKEDVCGRGGTGVLVSDVSISHVQQFIPPETQYACLYWARHLISSGQRLLDDGYMHQFLREHALHWMEAMSWMGKTSEAIEAMTSLESIAEGGECKTSRDLVQECKRFLMYARSGIEQAPLQVYVAAALFAPSSTVLREVGRKTRLISYVKRSPPTSEHWSALLLTLEGHSAAVKAVQFSPDGSKLASASYDNKVKVWDATTGAHLHTLEGHSGGVNAVQFSPDGSKLASASYDKKVKVWDASTGAHLHTLEGHSDEVTAVQFSPDGGKLASASMDKKVNVWDATTGAHLHTLEGHSSRVTAVQFSPDGSKLASASYDKKVKVWDASTGAHLHTLEGHSLTVNAAQFSPDGSKLASASYDKKVKVWDASTGAHLHTLEGHSGVVSDVQFSPDGSKLASASYDNKVNVWDASTGAHLHTLEGHSDEVTAVQFSPDGSKLASASYDNKVKVWDATTGAHLHTLEGHSGGVNAVQFSPDGSKLASASYDNKVKVWDASTGAHLHTLEGHSGVVSDVQFSPDGSKLASASYDNKVKVWDASTGAHLHTLEGHSGMVSDVQFSPDGSKLASASYDKKVKVWDASTGAHLHTLEGHSSRVTAVQFSPDGSKLASASMKKKVKVWDLNTTLPIQTIDVKEYVTNLAFSPDGLSLNVNIGSSKLGLGVGNPHDENSCTFHLQVAEDWILRHGHRTIWLPPEFRGHAHAMSVVGVMALGCSSGSVSFWEIEE